MEGLYSFTSDTGKIVVVPVKNLMPGMRLFCSILQMVDPPGLPFIPGLLLLVAPGTISQSVFPPEREPAVPHSGGIRRAMPVIHMTTGV
jgi:hypothetical protein